MTAHRNAALETEKLRFSYGDGGDVLKGISIRLGQGDYVALIGQNGSGKTTLAKHFLGLLRPSEGIIRVRGHDIQGQAIGEIARSVGYVFQNPDHQIFSATVREEVAYGPGNLQIPEAEVNRRTSEALQRFRLVEYAELQPAGLSYGLRRKVALASVYAMDSEVLILDEPTGGLDHRDELETIKLLDELNQRGKTIVLITHDMHLVAEHARSAILLHKGEVVTEGATRSTLEQAALLGITPPQVWRLSQTLGFTQPALSVDEFCSEFLRRLQGNRVKDVGSA